MSDRLQVLVTCVRDVGFPIVVAVILLWAFLKRVPTSEDIRDLAEALRANGSAQMARLDALERNQTRILDAMSREHGK